MMREIDLRGEACPYTFIKSKLVLEEMEVGQSLRIRLDHRPAVKNLVKSFGFDGHSILDVVSIADTEWEIVVKKERAD